MDKTKVIVGTILAVSLGLNLLLGVQLVMAYRKVQETQQKIHLNAATLHFADLFITKVLKATGSISFEDRLTIENAVRDTQDQQMVSQWEKFVGSKDEIEGRREMVELLHLVVNKIAQ